MLRDFLLSGSYQWSGGNGATESDLQALTAWSPVSLPDDYLEMLRISDGGDAEVSGHPSYVRFWSAKRVIESNEDYEVQEWLPGFIAFGDNGGSEMVGFDTRQGEPFPVCAIPFSPMEWVDAMGTVPSFSVFIGQLLPNEDAAKPPPKSPPVQHS